MAELKLELLDRIMGQSIENCESDNEVNEKMRLAFQHIGEVIAHDMARELYYILKDDVEGMDQVRH